MMLWSVVATVSLLFFGSSWGNNHVDCWERYKILRNIECRSYLCNPGYQCELSEDEEPVCVSTASVDEHISGILGEFCVKVVKTGSDVDACSLVCDSSCKLKGKKVCGQDGLIYPSRCHLRRCKCLLGYSIGIAEMDLCESGILSDSVYPREVVVHFDKPCIKDMYDKIMKRPISEWARVDKVDHAIKVAIKTYKKWKFGYDVAALRSNELFPDMYKNIMFLHAVKILIDEGVLPSADVELKNALDGLPMYGTVGFPQRYWEADICNTSFPKYAAVVDALHILGTTSVSGLFERSPLNENDCWHNSTVRLPCEAARVPAQSVAVQWFFKGRPIYVDLTGRYYIDSAGALYIKNVMPHHLGEYKCQATLQNCNTTAMKISTVQLVPDKCLCFYVSDMPILKHCSCGGSCMYVDKIDAVRTEVVNVELDELSIMSGTIEKIHIKDAKIKKLVISSLESLHLLNITDAEIGSLLVTNLTGVEVSFHDVLIHDLTMIQTELHNCTLQAAYVKNVNFHYSLLSNCAIENTSIQGLNMNFSVIQSSILSNTALVGLNLYQSTVSELMSDRVKYENNYLYGLTVSHSVFTNTELNNYTTIGSYRFNLTTINMTAYDMHSVGATIVDDITTNAIYQNLVVFNMTLSNAMSSNLEHTMATFKNSYFGSSTWYGILFNQTSFQNSTFQHSTFNKTSFDYVVIGGSWMKNLTFTSTSATNTLLSGVDTEDALIEDSMLKNYTSIDSTETNVMVVNMTASEMLLYNTQTVNKTTMESQYVNVLVVNTTATMSQDLDVLFANIEYVNVDFISQSWLKSHFYNSTFNQASFDYNVWEDCLFEEMLFMSTNFTNTLLSSANSEDIIVKDCMLNNHTMVNSSQINMTVQNLMATDFTVYNTSIINKTLIESTYVALKEFHKTALNTTATNVLYVSSTFSDNTYEDFTTNNVTCTQTNMVNSVLKNYMSIGDTAIDYYEDSVTYSHAWWQNGSMLNSKFNNVTVFDSYLVNAMHVAMVYENMSMYNYSVTDSTYENSTFLKSSLIGYVETNAIYVNIFTADVVYQQSTHNGTTVQDWLGQRETWSQSEGYHLNFNNVTLIDPYFTEISWFNVTISKWQLENGTFINGKYSWLAVDELESVNTTWDNNTGADVSLTNVNSLGTQITNNWICGGKFTNYVGVDQFLQYYEASGLVTENAVYENLTKKDYFYTDSAFINTTYNILTIAKGRYHNVSVYGQYINQTYQSDIETINMTAIDVHLLNGLVENNLFQYVMIINSTQAEFFIQNDTWIHTQLENTTHSNMVYRNLTYAGDVLLQSHQFINTEFEGFSANDVTLIQSLFYNASLKNSLLHNITLTESVFQLCNHSDTMYYLTDSSHNQFLYCSLVNTTFTNMNSYNDSWIELLMINSRMACPVFDGGLSKNITAVSSVLTHAELKNWQDTNFQAHQCILDEVAWSYGTFNNMLLRDVNITRMQALNVTLAGMNVINVFAHQMLTQHSKIEIVHADKFTVEIPWMWKSDFMLPKGMSPWTNGIMSPFTYGISRPCYIPGDDLNKNETSHFRMCDVDDSTTYLNCDANRLIANVTAVSGISEIHTYGCNVSAEDVRNIIIELCFLTPSCTVSSSALRLNCPLPDMCFNITYTCKMHEHIKGYSRGHVVTSDDDSHHIKGHYPKQSKQCRAPDFKDTYISCDGNHLIMDITAVSTVPEMSRFGKCSREAVFDSITSLCFLKPSCYVSTSALDLSCSMPDVCFKISYVCRPTEVVASQIKEIFMYAPMLLSRGNGHSEPMPTGQCVDERRTMCLECDDDDVIIDIAAKPGRSVCDKYPTDYISQQLVNLCLFKHKCDVSAPDLGFDTTCPIEDVCSVGITYSCQPSKTVLKAFEMVTKRMEEMASKTFVKASEIMAALHNDLQEAFFNGSSASLEEKAKSLETSVSTLVASSGMCSL